MKFGLIKNILKSHNFQFDSYQTGGNLPMLSYIHNSIGGEIFIEFDNDCILPDNILNDEEFSFNEKWIEDIDVVFITIDIDKSISFMSSNLIDVCGDRYENKIILNNDDVNMFGKIMNIICDPYSNINFQEEYNNEFLKFTNNVKKFLPILEKYDLKLNSFKLGSDSALYSGIIFRFEERTYEYVDFHFDIFTWRQKIIVNLYYNGFKEFDISCDLEIFEKEVKKQWSKYLKFQKSIN